MSVRYTQGETASLIGDTGSVQFTDAQIQDRFWAHPFPAGQLIYYRMKTETAVADTCTVHFRYHSH